MRDMSQRGCARRIPWHGHCFHLGMQWIVRMTERTGLAFAATVLALAIMQTATEGASARGYEDMTRLEQRIAEFGSRGGGHRQQHADRPLRLRGCTVPRGPLWSGTGGTPVIVRRGTPGTRPNY